MNTKDYKIFNGEKYVVWYPKNLVAYYRNTRTHRKLSHDVYEYYTGIKILPNEIIHHKNEDTLDDRFENLQKLSNGEHTRIHHVGVCMPWLAEWNRIHKIGNSYTKGRKYQEPLCGICGLPTLAKNLCKHHYYKQYNQMRRKVINT